MAAGADLDPRTEGASPVQSFNAKIADLLKQFSNEDVVQILKGVDSVIASLDNNINNNK